MAEIPLRETFCCLFSVLLPSNHLDDCQHQTHDKAAYRAVDPDPLQILTHFVLQHVNQASVVHLIQIFFDQYTKPEMISLNNGDQ
ncbi:hypothetical protein D3C75_788760 [compost metagenome]